MLHTKYQGSMLCGFRQEVCSCLFFHVFPIYALYVKHVTAGGGPFLAPGA